MTLLISLSHNSMGEKSASVFTCTCMEEPLKVDSKVERVEY